MISYSSFSMTPHDRSTYILVFNLDCIPSHYFLRGLEGVKVTHSGSRRNALSIVHPSTADIASIHMRLLSLPSSAIHSLDRAVKPGGFV
jgi:hypothetical protein